MAEVARVHARDTRTLTSELERGREPLVIQGAIDDFPALRTWSVEALSERLGHVRVGYKRSQTGDHPNFRAATLAECFARGESRFDELLRFVTTAPLDERSHRLLTGDEQFLLRRRDGRTEVNPELAPLLEDVEVPAAIAADRLYTIWPWFSGAGVRTWLHYDNNGCHNLNAQITGRKRAVLIPPDRIDGLELFSPGGENPAHNCSAIDLNDPTPSQRKTLSALATYETEIVRGELLFIPAWWLHAFVHLGELNANVNFWWKPRSPPDNAVSRRQAQLDARR